MQSYLKTCLDPCDLHSSFFFPRFHMQCIFHAGSVLFQSVLLWSSGIEVCFFQGRAACCSPLSPGSWSGTPCLLAEHCCLLAWMLAVITNNSSFKLFFLPHCHIFYMFFVHSTMLTVKNKVKDKLKSICTEYVFFWIKFKTITNFRAVP